MDNRRSSKQSSKGGTNTSSQNPKPILKNSAGGSSKGKKKEPNLLSYNKMALNSIQLEQQEEHSDSMLLDRIMDTALESSGQKISDKLSMLNLLGSYDKVIKAESSKVPAAQATRIYRQLLKMQRERQEDGGNLANSKRDSACLDDGLWTENLTRTIDTTEDCGVVLGSVEQSSNAVFTNDHFRSKQTVGADSNPQNLISELSNGGLTDRLPEPTKPSGMKRYSSHKQIKSSKIAKASSKARHSIDQKKGRAPTVQKKPPRSILAQKFDGHQKEEEPQAQVTLPKLSFSDLLNRAPKPREFKAEPQPLVKPHALMEAYNSKDSDLIYIQREDDQASHQQSSFTGPHNSQGSLNNLEGFEGRFRRMMTGTNATQSYSEFQLKPEITHFVKGTFDHALMTEDSSLLLHDESELHSLNMQPDQESQRLKAKDQDPPQKNYQSNRSLSKLEHAKSAAQIKVIETHQNSSIGTAGPSTIVSYRESSVKSAIQQPMARESSQELEKPAIIRDSSHLKTQAPFHQGDFSFENNNPNSRQGLRLETEPNEARCFNADLELTDPSSKKPVMTTQSKNESVNDYAENRRASQQELHGLLNIMKGNERSNSRPRSRQSVRSNGSKGSKRSTASNERTYSKNKRKAFAAKDKPFEAIKSPPQISSIPPGESTQLERELERECQQLDELQKMRALQLHNDMVFKQIEQKRELGNLIKEQQMAPRLDKSPTVVLDQDVRMSPIAEHHFKQKIKRKIFSVLLTHWKSQRRERFTEELALIHYETCIMKTVFKSFQFYTKILLPEERAMTAALKQFQIILKIKCFRELKLYVRKKKERLALLSTAQKALNHLKISKMFNEIVNYAAKSAIKKSLKNRADQKRLGQILKTAWKAMRIYKLYMADMQILEERAASHHLTITLRKSFIGLLSYLRSQQRQRELDKACDIHIDLNVNPSIKMQVFAALFKFAKKTKQLRKAQAHADVALCKKLLSGLRQACVIQKNYSNQKALSKEIYHQKLSQVCFKAWTEYVEEEQIELQCFTQKLDALKLKRQFRGLRQAIASECVPQPMSHRMQLVCATIMIKNSFEGMMADVWAEFPTHKIQRSSSVFRGKVDLMLPNLLQVSLSKKYSKYFIKVNQFMLEDVMKKAFRSLKINLRRMAVFKERAQFKFVRKAFKGLRQVVRGSALMRVFIERSDQVRTVKVKRNILHALRSAVWRRVSCENKFCQISRARQARVVRHSLATWTRKFKKATKRAHLEKLCEDFQKHRFMNKFLTIWVKKLSVQLKKKHLQTVVFPRAQKQFFVFNHFRAWQKLQRDHASLEQWLCSIEQFQNKESIQKCFKALSEYADRKGYQRTKKQRADQQYTYHIGLRAFTHLAVYARKQIDKRQLYSKIYQDFESKRLAQLFQAIKSHVYFKQNRLMMDLIAKKQIQKQIAKRFLTQWRFAYERRQTLKFLETSLDFARLRICFEHINRYGQNINENCSRINQMKSKHLLSQYFLGLKKLIQKKKQLSKVSEEYKSSESSKLERRVMRIWLRKIKTQQHYEKVFKWTLLQVKRGILRNYFKDLVKYQKYKQLKRIAPQLYENTIIQKAFQRIQRLWQRKALCRESFLMVSERREKIKRVNSFKLWYNCYIQSQLVSKNVQRLQAILAQQVFEGLKQHARRKITDRSVFMQKERELQVFKKSQALLKLYRFTQERQEHSQKMIIAESFNNQYMFHEAFRAWVYYYKSKKELISLGIKAKQISQKLMRRLFMGEWIKAAHRPLKKFESVRQISEIQKKRQTKQSFYSWCEFVIRSQTLDLKLEKHFLSREIKTKFNVLSTLNDHRIKKIDKRERIHELEQYHHNNLLVKSLRVFQWYVQERRDKQDMVAIANSQFANTILLRTFVVLQFICGQRQRIRHAHQQFQQVRLRKSGPGVFKKLRKNVGAQKQKRVLEKRALVFQAFKSYEKVFRGIFEYCVQKTQKSVNKQKAKVHYEFQSQRFTFDRIRDFSDQSRILKQKRSMMHQVILTIDHQNRLQKAFDGLFQNLIQSSDDAYYVSEHLKFLKLRRLFKAFEWNKHNQAQYKAAFEIINSKHRASRKLQVFGDWRTAFLKQRILQTYLNNKSQVLKARVLKALNQNRITQVNMKNCIEIKRFKEIRKSFQGLKQYCMLRAIKKAKREIAEAHKSKTLILKSVIALRQHNLKEKLVKSNVDQMNRKLKFDSFSEWILLFQRTQRKQSLLKSLILKKDLKEKSQVFKPWRKKVFFSKLLSLFYEGFDLEDENSEERLNSIKSASFRSLRRYSSRKVSLRTKYNTLNTAKNSKLQSKAFVAWRDFIKERLICMKLKTLVHKRLRSHFQTLKGYSDKQAQIEDIERELTMETKTNFKSRIMMAWFKLLEKRTSLFQFQAKRKLRLKKKIFQGFALNLEKKLERRHKEAVIIDHFGQRAPKVLNGFCKVFLILNYEQMVEKQKALLYGGSAHQQVLKFNFSVIEGQQPEDNLQSYTEDLGVYYEGVKLCSTVMAKYVFDKWRLVIPRLQEKRAKFEKAYNFHERNLKEKVIDGWSNRVNIKVKEKQLINFGREFFDECLLKRSFKIILEYKNRRKNIKQLKSIGDELKLIRLTQKIHKTLVTWYDLTVQSAQDEAKYDQIIYNFQEVQLDKKLPIIFFALKNYVSQQKEKRRIKEDMEVFAQQFYMRTLLKKVIQRLREHERMEQKQADLSKLYTIFQAWKYHVKESSLLKKYLDEANTENSINVSNGANEDALKLSFMKQNTQRQQLQKQASDLEKSGIDFKKSLSLNHLK